jgi:hypothetical protein
VRWLGDRLRGRPVTLLLGLLVLLAIGAARSRVRSTLASDGRSADASGPPFAHVDAAVWSLVTALQQDDSAALHRLLGDGVTLERALLAEASRELVWLEEVDERCVKLRLGFVGLAAPIPLVREVAGWRFASTAIQPSCGPASDR